MLRRIFWAFWALGGGSASILTKTFVGYEWHPSQPLKGLGLSIASIGQLTFSHPGNQKQ